MATPTHLVLPSTDNPVASSSSVHLFPFYTPFNGRTEISTYFLTRPTPDTRESALPDATLLTSAFRGRQLVGQPLRVPEGYEGVVLSVPEKKRPVQAETADELKREDEDVPMRDEPRELEDTGRRTSPRKRKVTARFGAGVAPPPPKKAAKKFRIDSDEDDSEPEDTPPASASTNPALTAIPTPLSPQPTMTATSTLVSSTSSTPLPTDMSAPASPPLTIIQDTRSRSPSPTPLSPNSQPAPILAPTTQEPVIEVEDASLLLPPPPTARELTVLSTFGEQGVTLWSADDPVDEGRDEYYRCLGKGGWVELAEALHQEESEDEA